MGTKSSPHLLRIVAPAIVACACALPVHAQVVTSCPSGFPSTQLFPYSGTPATFTVPANISQLRIIAVGADGGEITGGFAGGAGARAEGTFAVTQGQVVTVVSGQAPGGVNDFESGGGGASGAYIGATLALVAGAGGGDDNTGDAGSGTATNNGSNGGDPTTGDCEGGGLGGVGGQGGQNGERGPGACIGADGGAGGGGFLSAGMNSGSAGPHVGPTGGARCAIAGAAGGLGGAGDPSTGDGIGGPGGFGICGGGGADHRESGGGGGYSGGGGGPESRYPGGGGSFVSATATTPVLVAGSASGFGGGSGRNGSVRLCWPGADISVTKTNTFGSGPNDLPSDTVVAGSTQNYVIVISNNGPASANGAVVRDPLPTGLTCSAVSCSNASGGATCATTPALTVANLQSAGGVALNTLPSGGSVRLTLTCTVN